MRVKLLSCFSTHRFPAVSLFDPRSAPGRSFVPGRAAAGLAGLAALSFGGCAQQPPLQRTAHSKEYFPSSIYGPASPRVVADGEPVPRGGGVYMVGKPYSVAGHTYYPSEKRYAAVGLASWYGDAFHGRRTANGEIYDRDAITAAHPTMPLPSYARVTNLRNHYSMIVRVNDRGPFSSDRIMDVSRRTAEALDFRGSGTARVKVEYMGAADLAGTDDRALLATLRNNGPAHLEDGGLAVSSMVAETEASENPPAPIRTASAQEMDRSDVTSSIPSSAVAPAPPFRPGRSFAEATPLPPARPPGLGAAPRFGANQKRAARPRLGATAALNNSRTRQANLR